MAAQADHGLKPGLHPGFRLWAESYDEAPNPLVALEARVLRDRLNTVPGQTILDAGSGTGRWMSHMQAHGALVFGIDACHEMLMQSERKPGLRGRSALGDIEAIPMRDGAADLVICSFTLGYLPSIERAFREFGRVGRRVIVSDLHPDAVHAGWVRGDRVHDLSHFEHSAAELDECAAAAGLVSAWRIQAPFGEPERVIFERAGKVAAFDGVRSIPAVLVSAWNRA